MTRDVSPKKLEQLARARQNITKASYEKAARSRTIHPSLRIGKFRIVRGTNECWGWNGAKDKRGYGKIGYLGKTLIATHVALEADGRPRPSVEHCACHTCDNPECTNPRHLWWGTRSENTRDGRAKGRIKTPNEYGKGRWDNRELHFPIGEVRR